MTIVGASPTTCTKPLPIADCRLPILHGTNIQRAKSKSESSSLMNESIGNRQSSIKNVWKGSLTGKAVVLKTTAHSTLAGSSPVPSAKTMEASPNGMAVPIRRDQIATHCVCRFNSCRRRQNIADCRWSKDQRPKTKDLTTNRQSSMTIKNILGSVAQWN